ncbi:MAG: ribosome recycling factor [Hyphomicrobiaceae bacterium]
MASGTFDIKEFDRRMGGVIDTLKRDFGGLRTGRASSKLLEPVVVEIYGQKMPINQVGTISVPEPRMITVQVWDRASVSATDRAIREANLGLNPSIDGQILRMTIPELTKERRQELAKLAAKYAETARVAVRNVRRDANELLKKLEKDSSISQDDHRREQEKVQQLTDRFIKDIDQLLATKDTEINTV